MSLVLRAEVDGRDRRHLWASVDDAGDLHVDGQDLGPATAMVSGDGEYEWFQTIAAADVPALLVALGGRPDEDPMAVLARFTGRGSYDLEAVLRSGVVPVRRVVW